MSETQNEYETESETDAEPGFASAPWEPERPDESGHAHVWGSDGDLVATVCDNPVYGETAYDRARLIAAAGTAAQEAREMGYNPVAAVEVLPDLLARLVQIRTKLSASSLRREICVDDSMKEKVDEAVDLANDALASAEGSSNE